MTTTEILALAKKALNLSEFKDYRKALNSRDFKSMNKISEDSLSVAKDCLIENAIKEYCDPVLNSHYKLSNELRNETIEFTIINSEVNQ